MSLESKICPTCSAFYGAAETTCPNDGATLRPYDAAERFIGTVLAGAYELKEIIGRGAIGIVFRAHQASVGRDVAIKILREGFASNVEAVNRFEAEAKIISQLRHPNTLRLFDCQRTPQGALFIVTELLSGLSLRQAIRTEPMPLRRAVTIVEQALGALIEAHEAGVVHRDLKPENIFLDRVGGEDHVKILDFGVAKLAAGASHVTQANMVLGTPTYMAPEQAAGKSADARADIYALGIVLYELLTGTPPFVAESPVAVMLLQMNEAPRPLQQATTSDRYAEISPQLETLVMRMIAKAPDDRVQSASEAREVLRDVRSATGKMSASISIPIAEAGPFSDSSRSISADLSDEILTDDERPHHMSGPVSAPSPTPSFRTVEIVGALLLALILVGAIGTSRWFSSDDSDSVITEALPDETNPARVSKSGANDARGPASVAKTPPKAVVVAPEPSRDPERMPPAASGSDEPKFDDAPAEPPAPRPKMQDPDLLRGDAHSEPTIEVDEADLMGGAPPNDDSDDLEARLDAVFEKGVGSATSSVSEPKQKRRRASKPTPSADTSSTS